MNTDTAQETAYSLVAMAQNAATNHEFPGLDVLGLDESQTHLIHAVVNAHLAAYHWAEHGDNSAPYGVLETMIHFGLVDPADIRTALHRARTLGRYLGGGYLGAD